MNIPVLREILATGSDIDGWDQFKDTICGEALIEDLSHQSGPGAHGAF